MTGREPRAVELRWPDGTVETVTAEVGQTVVDAAEAAGVAVPYGCLYGACATCTAQVLDGELTHTESPRALKESALEAGYVLPCIATPESDCRLRVGHEIQAEVLGTPWK